MDELKSEFLFEMKAYLDRDGAQPIDDTPNGSRYIVYVTGGSFEGPDLRGEILPGGGDWVVRRPDGVGVLDVRITLRTDDDALIYMRYRGLSHNLPVRPGDVAESEERYFRTAPFFETGDERYAWLNRIIAVGVGGLPVEGGVGYRVYAIR
jgi:hypothetical protein